MCATRHRVLAGSFYASILTAALMCIAESASADVVNFTITVDGSQETPATSSTGTGNGIATLDTVTNLFSWNVSYSGLSATETASHFHGNALQCVAAGVIIGLPIGSPKVGSSTVSPAQAANILDGKWYLNIHTTAFPGGEIRGQVVPSSIGNPIDAPIPDGSIHVKLDTVATGLTAPNWGTFAPGDSTRIFVTDITGNLWAITLSNGNKTVFLDTQPLLVTVGIGGPGSYDERGFLGVTFHPDYQKNGLLYTYTSEPASGPADYSTQPIGVPPDCQSVVREWHVPDPGNPNSVVDPNSTRVLLRVDKPQFNHNAGTVLFGPDNLLYITIGDGGGADDKDGQDFIGGPTVGHGCSGNGQNTMAALGKVLRIDPQGTNSANGQYGIPPSNPFVGMAGFIPEIYAYGFRNPFRYSFDSATGQLYLADVGQNNIEEVDIVTAGGNYGWRYKEGSYFFQPNGNSNGYVESLPQTVPAGLIDPIAQYDHDEGIAVIGGFVYRGAHLGPLVGRYVFGELAPLFNNDGRLFYLDGANQINEFQYVGQPSFGLFLLGFATDANGNIYALANGNGVTGGTTGVVLRIGFKPGDINGDGVTNTADLLAIINNWGPCPAPPAACGADVAPPPNGDGTVNTADLLYVINNWG